jgi:hypothetical protein
MIGAQMQNAIATIKLEISIHMIAPYGFNLLSA